MKKTDIEIEIQVKVENVKPLQEFLEKNGQFVSEKHQIDEYFSPSHRDFVEVRPVKEWLRLRNSNGKYSINYKNWYFDNTGKSHHYCDEFETEIGDIEQLRKIFLALNFKPLITVEKTRKIWNYKDYEIAIDSVKRLGDFVEIEYRADNKGKNIKEITDGMINFLKQVGCGKLKVNNGGYPFLLLFPEEAQFEER